MFVTVIKILLYFIFIKVAKKHLLLSPQFKRHSNNFAARQSPALRTTTTHLRDNNSLSHAITENAGFRYFHGVMRVVLRCLWSESFVFQLILVFKFVQFLLKILSLSERLSFCGSEVDTRACWIIECIPLFDCSSQIWISDFWAELKG